MDFNIDEINDDNYMVNINKIVDDETVHPVVKKFALEFKRRGYIAPGDYFSNIPSSDLEILRTMLMGFHGGNFDDQQNLLLLAILMASAEGIDICDEHMEKFLKSISVFTTLEYLDRNKLAVAIRENFTFDPDSNDAIARNI